MNRPQEEDFVTDVDAEDYSYDKELSELYGYMHALNVYCDELECSNKSLDNALDDCMKTNHYLENELEKYRNSLDKACYYLLDTVPHNIARFHTKEEWKEFLLKNE